MTVHTSTPLKNYLLTKRSFIFVFPKVRSAGVKAESPNISLVVVIGLVERWIRVDIPDKPEFLTHTPPVDMLMKTIATEENLKVIHSYPQVYVDIHRSVNKNPTSKGIPNNLSSQLSTVC